MAAEHIMHIQKALDQMNLQVHRVLSEITGLGGLRILDAVYANRRRAQGSYGKSRLKRRSELVERSFAHCYDTGGHAAHASCTSTRTSSSGN
jgi:hypothetical protein